MKSVMPNRGGYFPDRGAVGLVPVELQILLLLEKQRQSVFFSCRAKQRDDAVRRVLCIAVERVADLAVYPALDAGVANQHDKVNGISQGPFERLLPFFAGHQLVEIEPDVDPCVPE